MTKPGSGKQKLVTDVTPRPAWADRVTAHSKPMEFAMAALGNCVISSDFGTGVPDYSKVLAYAERKISELKQSGNADGFGGLVIVNDQAGNRIACLPFSPAVC
jgi:hypothetical protein